MKPEALDQRIIAALTTATASTDVKAALDDARAAMKAAAEAAVHAELESLNPLATAADADALRREAGDKRFQSDRLEASVSALDVRFEELAEAERSARTTARHGQVLARRDELAADIADQYPLIVGQLTALAKRIEESDAELQREHLSPSAEALGRGCPPNFYDRSGGPLTRIVNMFVPMPADSRGAWEAAHDGGRRWHGLAFHAEDSDAG